MTRLQVRQPSEYHNYHHPSYKLKNLGVRKETNHQVSIPPVYFSSLQNFTFFLQVCLCPFSRYSSSSDETSCGKEREGPRRRGRMHHTPSSLLPFQPRTLSPPPPPKKRNHVPCSPLFSRQPNPTQDPCIDFPSARLGTTGQTARTEPREDPNHIILR